MKILFLGENPKKSGGIETFGRNLKSIFKERLEFISLYKEKNVLYEVEDVKEIFERTLINRMLVKFLKPTLLKKIINKNQKKIFILNSPQYLKFFSKKNKKIIMIQHQTSKEYWERVYYFNKSKSLVKRVQNEIDVMVTLSPFDKEDFIKKFKLERSKVSVIRHTSNMELLEGNKNKNKNIIMVCRLNNSHKRIDLAIEAMKELPDYTLNIYGSGPDEEMLKTLAKNLKNVFFHGNTNKVQEKLDDNAIHIMTSDFEGYGITNIEAMRRGLPLIVRDTYVAAKDIVQGNGVLLKKEWDEDKFIEAIRDVYENYEKYSKKSIKLGKRYSFEIIEKEWKDLIEKI